MTLTLEWGWDSLVSVRLNPSQFPIVMNVTSPTPTIPPYVPYRTFRNFLEFLREGVPARIDRSIWGQRASGSTGIQLMTALRVLELVDDDGRPTEDLEHLAGLDGDERRAALATLLRRHYPPVFALDLTRATRAQFREAFRNFGAKEGVLAKCEAFFIQAAQDAGLELSSYILAGRHVSRRSSSGSSRPRQPSAERSPAQPAPVVVAAPVQTAGVSIAEMVLKKYPDFDPNWDVTTQQKWFDGMTKLMDSLGQSGGDQASGDSGAG